MDKQTAKQKLKELRDSLSQVLEGKDYQSAEEVKEQSAEAIKQARSASKQLKKSFIEKIKDLPVVQKVSELGTAGSVAVSTAAVAQTTVAVDQTEVFVASVANDVVEERIEVPFFVDAIVDFHYLDDWGQEAMVEKMEEAQEFVDKVEAIAAPSPSQSETPSGGDPKPSSSASLPSESQKSDGPSEQKQAESKSEQQSEKGAKAEEKNPSEKSKEESEKSDKSDKQEQSLEQKTEDKQEPQEKESSSETSTEPNNVKDLPIVNTPFDPMDDELRPHRQVSPI